MPDYQPKFKPGAAITRSLTATVTGGQLVTVAGAPAGADSVTFLGVAGHDGVAGDQVTVFCDGVQRLTAAAALAVGALVKCAAAGQITTHTPGTDAAERLVGVTLEAAAGVGSIVAVKMR